MDERDAEVVRWCQLHAREPVLLGTLEAADAWGANCGPMSLAAVLRLGIVEGARELVQPFRGFMSPTDMYQAVKRAESRGLCKFLGRGTIGRGDPDPWPTLGLVRIQWIGPWCDPGANPRAAYRYTHFVAVKHLEEPGHCTMIYDATPNRWLPLWLWSKWCTSLLPKRATGWAPVNSIEIAAAADISR